MKLFLICFLLFSCSITKFIEPPKLIVLSNKKQIIQNNTIIELFNVEDSRCPEGVRCFTAGSAKITLRITENKLVKEITFQSDKNDSIRLFGKNYLFKKLIPYPKKELSIALNEYVLELKLIISSSE